MARMVLMVTTMIMLHYKKMTVVMKVLMVTRMVIMQVIKMTMVMQRIFLKIFMNDTYWILACRLLNWRWLRWTEILHR